MWLHEFTDFVPVCSCEGASCKYLILRWLLIAPQFHSQNRKKASAEQRTAFGVVNGEHRVALAISLLLEVVLRMVLHLTNGRFLSLPFQCAPIDVYYRQAVAVRARFW